MRISRRHRLAGLILSVAAAVAGLFGVSAAVSPGAADAFTGSDFSPGYIISDYQFYNSAAMTEADIQAFLNSKIGSCGNGQCLNVLKVDTSNRAADNMCLVGYTGAPAEPVARIIFKVQYSCGISAKAILVTLQKEQGLVTSKAPSDSAIRIAMGYGCPDTAACDSTYYGIFNQIYQAARQLKRYGLSAPDNTIFHYIPVGAYDAIRFSPNAACGSGTVYIQNKATAALYYYTPYQPNAAALANLGGTGDGCSSYGNRNFWWYYYNWFGNPLTGAGDESLDSAYATSGGATGPLGAATGTHNCGTATTCQASYDNGAIYWSLTTGAFPVIGGMNTAYLGAGGPSSLGWPTSSLVTDPSSGGGTGQSFQYGSLYSSAGGTWAVVGAFRNAYWALNGSSGVMGWPTSAVASIPQNGGGTGQSFQAGSIYSSSSGLYLVGPPISVVYLAGGGASGAYGWPTSPTISLSSNGSGTAQVFQNASIYSSAAGTFAVSGAIRASYWSSNGSDGRYGWPTAAQTCDVTGCAQNFQNGSISTRQAVSSDIDSAYAAAGGASGPLGAAISGVISSSDNGGGVARAYRGGSIYSSTAGTFLVSGAVAAAYWARGGSAGPLGWPTVAATCGLPSSGCEQAFQFGTIFAAPQITGHSTAGTVATFYVAAGGPAGSLGWPTSDLLVLGDSGGGTAQAFQKGSVYAGPPGAFSVQGPIAAAYWATGGSAGPLGWPTSGRLDYSENGGGTAQAFQSGSVYSSIAGAFTVSGAIANAYWAQQGATGAFGWPASAQAVSTSNGGGYGQMFQNASLYASPAGAFAVKGAIRSAYWANGGSDGSYGWPTSAQTCVSGSSNCSQAFQHGTITVP